MGETCAISWGINAPSIQAVLELVIEDVQTFFKFWPRFFELQKNVTKTYPLDKTDVHQIVIRMTKRG